mgnify:CR=1 FL=1
MYSVADFISKFKIGARPNLFRVDVDMMGQMCQFMCKGAQIPGRTTGKMPINYMDNGFYLAGDTTYQDWTISVINDINFDVRFRLEDWMNMIKMQGTSLGVSGYSYMFDSRITQLDALGNDVVTYVLYNSFPVDISPIDLNWENRGSIQDYQVIFTFTHFGKE